jgi:hypothetical protein
MTILSSKNSQELVEASFREKFVQECTALGDTKFIPIPVGSTRASVLPFLPQLT